MHFDLNENEIETQILTLSNKGDANLNYEVKFPNGKDWISTSNQVSKKELKTTFAGGNGSTANYIQVNIHNPNGINVTALTGHFRGTGEVNVWKRKGEIEDATQSTNGWEQVASSKISKSGVLAKSISIDSDISDKNLATTSSFQKTFKTDFVLQQGKHTLLFSNKTIGVKYTNASFGTISAKDENLSIYVGYGTSRKTPSERSVLHKGRKWNGTIHYSANSTNKNGTLQAGKSVKIKAIGKEKEMSSEYEEANILISSNDPEKPEKKIRVTAQKLSEKGGLVFRPSTLNFGNTFIGQANKRTISISNADTNPITIRKFAFDNSVFTHGFKLPLVLNSGEKLEEQFFFTPTKSGKLSSSATILTDENGLKVRNYSVNGSGMIAPSMVVTPNSFSTNLLMNKEKNLSLYISNKGGSPLNWNF
jgi:hypothetical protein